MCISELFNLKKILNNILATTIITVISLLNLKKGLTSHIPMDDTRRNTTFQFFPPTNDFGNTASFSTNMSSWYLIKPQQHEIIDISYNSGINRSPIVTGETDQENSTNFDLHGTPNSIEKSPNKLFSSSGYVPHKVADILTSNVDNNVYAVNESKSLNKLNTAMYFGTENSTIIASQIGASAHIPCTVHHIGECVVSWIRKKDYHLLTVGLTTYSSDERFSATHLKNSEDWTLQIKYVQQRDAGIYECQVSTHPPTSIFLHLIVVEARAEISGPHIRYLTPGSTLRLQCHVVQNTEKSDYIFWYHDNRMINYDGDRGINVSTEPDFQSSELIISRTKREHSGNYTCVASNTQPASVLIHIFKGDNPAAMYHGHVGSLTKSYQTHLIYIMLTIANIYSTYVKKYI